MDPGGILVDKPVGPTSHDIVGVIRKASGLRRVGHAGTLDPFASGLLILLLGQATRLSEYLIGMDKDYRATVHLGVETETHDPEGPVTSRSDAWTGLSRDDVESAAMALTGRIAQRPPVFSAKKVGGEAAHRRARRGESVELKPVEVDVYAFTVEGFEPPDVHVAVHCSSGTYIRSLARDLGRALGVGAHLTSLRRTAIGPFSVENAMPMDPLPEGRGLEDVRLTPAALLDHLPSVDLGESEAERMRHGQFLPNPESGLAGTGLVRALCGGDLVAVAAVEDGLLKPRKVMAHG